MMFCRIEPWTNVDFSHAFVTSCYLLRVEWIERNGTGSVRVCMALDLIHTTTTILPSWRNVVLSICMF